MALGIIGDSYVHHKTFESVQKRKLSMNAAKEQGITGNKFNKPREMEEKIVFVSSLRTEIQQQKGFVEQNKTSVKLRLGEAERVIRSLAHEAEQFKENLVLFNDGTEKDPGVLLSVCKKHMCVIEREGNTMVGNSYIFGGTITNTPTFDLSKIPDGLYPDVDPDTQYYNGNNILTPVAIDRNSSETIDILGNHPAFEKFIRALKIAHDPSVKSGDERITKAQELVDESIDELAQLISVVGSKEKSINDLVEVQENRLTYIETKLEDLIKADDLETTFNFMEDMKSLNIMYQMLGKTSEMSLVDHLR